MADNKVINPPLFSNCGVDYKLIESASGYGRELFFSNILHYIARNYPDVIKEALRKFLPDGFDYAVREYCHTDLAFFDKNEPKKPILIIENKRGAIAQYEQLKKYKQEFDDNTKNCRFLLISPHFLEKRVADRANWEFLDYEQLGAALSSAIKREFVRSEMSCFDYSMLNAVTLYMKDLKCKFDSIYTSVKASVREGRTCKEVLHSKNNKDEKSRGSLNARYYAVSGLLAERADNDIELQDFICYFESGTSNPIVHFDLDENKIKYNGLTCQIFFQDKQIAIGFGKKGKFKNLSKTKKKEHRRKFWDKKHLSDPINYIIKDIDDKYKKEYDGEGYMTTKYILPMYKIDVGDETVDQIITMICNFARRTINFIRNNNK